MFLEKVLSHISAKHGQFLELVLAPATLLRRLTADSFFTRGLQNEKLNSFAPAFALPKSLSKDEKSLDKFNSLQN